MEQRQQERLQQEVDAATIRENERLNALSVDIGDGLQRAGEALIAGDYTTVRSIIYDSRARAAAEPRRVFARQIAEMDHILGVAAARETQEIICRSRLKELDELNAAKKYRDAVNLANALLKEPFLPSEIAEHARAALATAEEAMKKPRANWLRSILRWRSDKE